jgi:YidC/Oxa1 family membrane protein insertase
MDRNSIIGFVLLLALAAGYFFYSNHEQQVYQEQKQKYADSVAKANPKKNIAEAKSADTLVAAMVDTTLPLAFRGTTEMVNLSNGYLSLQFSTKGGVPVQSGLDSFKTYDGKPLHFFKGDKNRFSVVIPVNGKNLYSDELFYTPQQTTDANGNQVLTMTAEVANGQKIIWTYSLPENGYMMSANLRLIGLERDLAAVKSLPLTWTTEALHTEKDLKNERLNAQVHYRFDDGEHDYFTIQRTDNQQMERGLQWLGVRTHFFSSTIIGDKPFLNGDFKGSLPADSNIVVANTSRLAIPVSASNDYSYGFRWYMGPTDYKILKSYKIDLEEQIPLGFGIFFFVKYISKWMIIPLFDFLSQFISSFGIIIICITLIIRLLLSFFTYKSYLSSAKMRVLKPELDELRAKYGDNQQQMSMEQMKLYRTAGVNPLGGCLPMLLQMPFLLAMYYFFPTAIQLRQSKFLWSDDLSTYDSVLDLPFNIPMYGDHVSLFTLLMTITSLFLAVYNRNMTAGATPGGNDMNTKMLKWMPFIMPILFLGWFNEMAAGLTFYYTFSNILSILQQFIIQKFIINEDKIHAKIQENKNKPATTSKWAQRLEEMQKAQAERLKQRK